MMLIVAIISCVGSSAHESTWSSFRYGHHLPVRFQLETSLNNVLIDLSGGNNSAEIVDVVYSDVTEPRRLAILWAVSKHQGATHSSHMSAIEMMLPSW